MEKGTIVKLAIAGLILIGTLTLVGSCASADFGNPPEDGTEQIGDDDTDYGPRIKRFVRTDEDARRDGVSEGNEVRLLLDGHETFEAMLAAIDGAEHHVHLETYIIKDDEVGQRFAKALIERSNAGVRVRVIFDGFGSTDDDAFWERMTDAGVEIHEYNPPEPENPNFFRYNNRDHRKILVVDGVVAFTGGINFYEVYTNPTGVRQTSGGGWSEKILGQDPTTMPWRDTHIRIKGPAVADLQRMFVRHWEDNDDPMPKDGLYPELARSGDDQVEILAGVGGDDEPSEIYGGYVDAINAARDRIWITQAYFVPNEEFIDILIDAAERGVEVRIIAPGVTDIDMVLHASRATYGELLEAGVRIHEVQGAILHAKTAVIDGVWSTVGSSNLDYRSFLHNHEVNAVIVGRSFGAEMESIFRDDLQKTRQITLDAYENRPLGYKALEQVATLIKPWI